MQKITTTAAILSTVAFTVALMGPLSASAAGPAAINLLSASNFAILSKAGISTTGPTSVTGDIGVSPAAATSLTGFSLTLPSGSAFATSPQVSGKVYAPGYAAPTPTNITTSVSDMQTAYTDGAGRTNPTATELGTGNIGGLVLAPGLYKWSTGVTIPTDVTLSGSTNDVWIFQIAQTLTVSSGVTVHLAGGAQASNVFWVVAGQTTIGTTAAFSGTILDQTGIVLNTGATLRGQALAQTAVTLDSNAVTLPVLVVAPAPTPTPTPTPAPTPTPSTLNPVTSSTSVSSTTTSTSTSTTATPTPAPTTTASTPSSSSGQASSPQATTTTTVNPTTVTVSTNASSFGKSINAISGNLKTGRTGDSVKTLQQFLIAQHVGGQALISFGADGQFGPVTRAALIQWQSSHDLVADGILGPMTKAKISTLGL